VAQIALRVKTIEFGRSDQGVDRLGAFASRMSADKKIVLASRATARSVRSAALLSISKCPSSR
jgi:hypothetical protein